MARVPLPGVELIQAFEGLRLEAYPDPRTGGEPITIGWGSTRRQDGSPFYLGDRITRQEADDLLLTQLEQDYLPPLTQIPGWSGMSVNQQGAILSFAYNLGAHFYGAKGFETISRVLTQQDWPQIESALVLYRNPGSNVEEGLLRRRLQEADLFLSGTPKIELSAAGRQYLSGERTPSLNSNLSQEAQAYLAAQFGSTGGSSTSGDQNGGRPVLFLTTPPMQGEEVITAQTALVKKGQTLVVDGIFGPATKAAVIDFQRRYGLVADGVIGQKTWDLLIDRVLYLTSPNLKGEDVRVVQQALTRAGFAVTADGLFGPGTEQAVKQFQASRGLVADGVVGPQTRSRLGV